VETAGGALLVEIVVRAVIGKIEEPESSVSSDDNKGLGTAGRLQAPSQSKSVKRKSSKYLMGSSSSSSHSRQKSDPAAMAADLGNANRKIETLENEVTTQAALITQHETQEERYRTELEVLRSRLQAQGLSIDVPQSAFASVPNALVTATVNVSSGQSLPLTQSPRDDEKIKAAAQY